jgi:hypothetical protein
MANQSETHGNTPGTHEDHPGSTSQMKRGDQSGTTSQVSDQSSKEHGGSGTAGGRPGDKNKNQPAVPGSGASQHTNAGNTGTGSGQISPKSGTSGQSSSGGDRNT